MTAPLTREEEIARAYDGHVPSWDDGLPITAEERFAKLRAIHGGDFRALAALLRAGAPLSKPTRELIAQFLENSKPPRGRGAPRAWWNIERDAHIANTYVALRACKVNAEEARGQIADQWGLSTNRVEKIITAEKRRTRELLNKYRVDKSGN